MLEKDDLANLKPEVDKLDIDKLENVPSGLNTLKSKIDELDISKSKITPSDFSKVSNPFKKEVVKKSEYDELIKKVNAIDTSKLVNKTNYSAKIKDIEDEIPDITNLATTAGLNAKINDFKYEISSISGLATTATLSAVKKKIPGVNTLGNKADYDAKISEMKKKKKIFTTSHCNKSRNNIPHAKITEKKVMKHIGNFVKKTGFNDKLKHVNRKITSDKTKHVGGEKKLKELSERVKVLSTNRGE